MASTAALDVLDADWDPDAWWTTTNFGEAVPGVLTALNWSFWSELGERAVRRVFHTIGTLDAAELGVPADPADRILGVFHGRIAGKVDFLGRMGDRLPGTTGALVAESLIGELPPGFTSHPTRAHYLTVARGLPPTFVTLPRRLRALDAETARWWAARTAGEPSDLAAAQAQFREGQRWFERTLFHQVLSIFAGVQPVYDRVHALAAKAGDPTLAPRLLAGQGSHAELALVDGLWDLSRGRIDLARFQSEHGFHGPAEGEIASHVWREDPAPVLALVEHYKRVGEAASPAAVLRERAAEREQAKAELLHGLGRAGRPAAELTLRLAATYIPIRGLGKASFLRSLDVARAAARRIGVLLADGGALDSPDDVHHLTADELLGARPSDALQDLVAARRAQRDAHALLSFSSAWKGRPVPSTDGPQAAEAPGAVLTGLGVSPGTVEGLVRVVDDPGFADVEDGEILVARFTDPSWASIMYCSAALVVEVGGALSHAAVVARELGVPCVMGVAGAMTRLTTGDRCRVDGQRGTIEILAGAALAAS
ncbi:MAG: PEP-utilizing protein mobile region [Solirubrobacterales bacterium]|nr:PEP-utilizing protein mobile region [Solirubrobacterales bacterium]